MPHHLRNSDDYYVPVPPAKLFFCIFFASVGGSPLDPEFLQYYTMILQRPRVIVGDAGYEPGTSASEVWRATNVAITSPCSHHISM